MPVLKNQRHERFAQALAARKTAKEAYHLAGYKPDEGNPSKMAARPAIQARVLEITSKAAERAGIEAERVLAEMAKVAFSDIRQVVSWRPEMTKLPGSEINALVSKVTVLDSASLSDDVAASISEVSEGANGSIRVKLHDKRAALVDLGKHLGLFKDKIEHTGKDGGPIETISHDPRDLARAVLDLLREADIEEKSP